MKNSALRGWLLPLGLLLGGACLTSAQTQIPMPVNSGPVSYTLNPPANCSFVFTDDAGGNSAYSLGAGAGSVVTFWPSSPGNRIVVQFTSFHTEQGFDGLFVYDGPDVSAPQISSGAAALLGLPNPFSAGIGAWQGTLAPYNAAPNTLRATAANSSGALSFAFDSDLSIGKSGWTAIVSEVPGNACSMLAPGALTVAAPAGFCTADVQTLLPNIQPAACATALELRYRLNDGPAVLVPAPIPPAITLQDLPVGLNVVSWQLVEPCAGGLAASAAQLITVSDQRPPTIVVPPSITLNLGPGECSATHSYAVSAFDNCSFDTKAPVEHPIDFNNGAAGILFDLKNLSTETIVITEFGPALDAGNWPLEIYRTKTAASWQGVEHTPAAWTLAGTRNVVSSGPSAGTPLSGFRLELPPGASRGVYLTSTLGAPVRFTGTGSGLQREKNDGTLSVSSAPGASKGYPFGQTYLSRAYNGYVRYASSKLTVQQIDGLPSDAGFPAGKTVNVFRCTDQAGNSATASFSVTVQAFANPANTLICAGIVNASLGPTCATTLSADDILVGGPYQCYDLYLVQVDKIPPFQDGPWVPAYLTSADVGKSYGVRVTAPQNGNTCLGTVLVEDKLPPVLTGPDVDLPCNFDTDPTYNASASVVREFLPSTVLPLSVTDFQTRELNIPAATPADALVEDIDVYLKISGDVFEKNLSVELESPSGVKVLLWKQPTGCGGPLWVRFDDEGSGSLDCAQFTTNKRARIPLNSGQLASFDGQPVNGTWKLRVRDLNAFGDVATVSEASLQIRYKATFSAGFPGGLAFPGQITQVAPMAFSVPAPLLDGCSEVALSYSDELTSKPCSTGLSAVISRTWTARDASNNTAKLVQTIRLMRPDFSDVVMPPNFNKIDAPAFTCGSAYPTPAWIESQGLQGAPYVFGRPVGCSINWSYSDIVVDICPGSYSINRSWSVVDACTAQSIQAMQFIQVLDQKEPEMTCPGNLTVSTDLYTCCATVNLPDIVVEDACSVIANPRASVVVFNQYSGDTTQVSTVNGTLTTFPGNNPAKPDTLAAFGNTPCLPIGTHHVYYKVEDVCGNLKTCSFSLSIRDYTPPVALGHSLTVVSLNADDPNDCYEPAADGQHFSGVTVVPATTFDQGSYDNCNFVRVTVRRLPPYSTCIQELNAVNGNPPCNDAFPDLKSEYAKAIAEADSIKFFCCEAGTKQTLALRCYQLNALGQYSLGPNGMPIFNETTVQVEVQDKLKPGCQILGNIAVSCENFDPTLTTYGLPSLQDNCCLDATKTYQNKPGLSHSLNNTQFDTLCNRGTLVRTFTVFDCQGQTSQCTQQIVVTRDVDYAIRFPDDVIVPFCDSSGIFGKPEFYGKDCELLGVSFTDEVFTVVPDACYHIERTWRVIDWCDHLPGSQCVKVPNPTPNAMLNAPQNLPGPIVAPPGTPAPWTATVVKTTPSSQQATDYSTFWNPTINCYEYTQVIKVIDTKAPLVEKCPDDTTKFGDLTVNAGDLWNETYWYDDSISSHNLCEGPTDLTTTGFGLCAGANVNINYFLFLDLDGNGTPETVVNSAKLPVANTVMFGNALNPNFTGGTARAFDERPVPAAQKYGFALQKVSSGGKMTATVRWNTQQAPDTYVVPELPYGKHMVQWVVSDGCGNETVCENKFVVQDDKAPTVVCINGLSINIMPGAMVPLWASDFLQYAEDNYTPVGQLRIGIRISGTGTGFPFEADGVTPQSSISFTCADLGTQLVELWVMDAGGNADYCETYVVVQDNLGNCIASPGTIAGALKNETTKGLEGATVTLTGTHPAVPLGGYSDMTDMQGNYLFSAFPPVGSYTVTPSKDDDPLNGVSTYDLVLINKHILGLEPLPSPYKMIAADANNSRSITTFDVVELRKLILGIFTDFPSNSSWRFVDKAYSFPNPSNPFQEVFPETTQIPDAALGIGIHDFVAVKVGDVNGNAVTSNLMQSEERTAGELVFDVNPTPALPNREGDRKLRVGETFTVALRAAEKVKGYQFTLQFPELEVLEVTPGAEMTQGNFGIFKEQHSLTTSFDNEEVQGEFAVSFRAKKGGMLSEMLKVSGQITRAEAYLSAEALAQADDAMTNDVSSYAGASADKMSIALRFNGQNGPVITAQGFEVYQNQPNPWMQCTQIGFYLPEATAATLRVYDETGRLLYATTGDFGKGYNAFVLDRALLEATGVLYYKVETAMDSGVKKMVRAK